MRGEAGGRSLRRSKNTKQIATGKFFEVGVAPAAANQLGEEFWEAAHILEPLGLVCAAIEVAADADVIAASDAGNVVDVVRDLAQRRDGGRAVDGGVVLLQLLHNVATTNQYLKTTVERLQRVARALRRGTADSQPVANMCAGTRAGATMSISNPI